MSHLFVSQARVDAQNDLVTRLGRYQAIYTGGEQALLGPDSATREHYRLLASLSVQLPAGTVLLDGGTSSGLSSLAFAAGNPNVTVWTCDLQDMRPPGPRPLNVLFLQWNVLHHVELFVEKCPLLFLDVDPHDGFQERNFVEQLHEFRFRGVLVLDDLYYSPAMTDFWNWAKTTVPKALDVTEYGHWSGTGVLVFDPTFMDVLVE